MLTRVNIFPRLRAAIFLSLVSGMIATITTRDAAAQAVLPDFIIEISMGAENACFYEMKDSSGVRLSNQDRLFVKPGNKVNFKAIHVKAVIDVSKNDSTAYPRQGNRPGLAGGPNNNSFVLAPGGDKTVNARRNNGNGNSRHKIGIMCGIGSNTKPSGPSFDSIGSITLIPAVPLPDPGLTIPGPKWINIRIPDLKSLPPSPWRLPGGPEMEVEE